jgi:two-component system, cell cycle response regulator DivK
MPPRPDDSTARSERERLLVDRPPIVLVVDDHADSREMCVQYLTLSGFVTAEAGDGVEAVAQALATLPDCILMDLSLPRMDGWEATQRLKTDPRTRDIPVVALTAHARAGEPDQLIRTGFAACITKPYLPERLLAAITRVIRPRV